MSHRIPDLKIKSYMHRYKAGDKTTYSSIIQMLSPYIYNYPRIVFSTSSDLCGDFYEYIIRRLEKILDLYKESDAKFVTWFTVVLRNRYLNFIRERRSKNSVEERFGVVSLDRSDEDSQSLYDLIGEERNFIHSDKIQYNTLIDEIVRYLNERQRLFFHLYFIESLRPEDVGFLSIALNRPVREVLSGIDLLRNAMIRKYEMKNRSLAKLNLLHQEVLRTQRDGKHGEAAYIRKKRERVLEEYRRMKLNPSYEGIAEFLKLPLGTVSTGIARMKKAVKNVLEELYEELYNEELPVS